MSKKVGVLLSGCGVFDGAEIYEAVITLLTLDRAGAEAVCMAPDVEQMHVINHITSQPMEGEKRNVLVEASRICRGEITDIAQVKADELDALILPGGFGAAKNLSTFAVDGPKGKLHPEVKRLIEEVHGAGKPIGAICISPAVIALALGKSAPELTIGSDEGTAGALEACGAKHIECVTTAIHVDKANKIVSTPAYMLGPNIASVAEGIEKCVAEVLSLA